MLSFTFQCVPHLSLNSPRRCYFPHLDIVVVLRIQPKLRWMLPMGVRDNHTKYEPKTQPWRPRTGVSRGGPLFQNMWKMAKHGCFGAACVPRMSM